MVDVSDKAETDRVAVAGARVVMRPETLARIRPARVAKGDVLAVARLAGIMAGEAHRRADPAVPPAGPDLGRRSNSPACPSARRSRSPRPAGCTGAPGSRWRR